MNLKRNLHWIIYSLFIISCAKQTSPTGGPKDTIPPVLVKAFPAREAINYKGNTMELLFSEMVVPNNPKEQLIVTPSIGKDYEVRNKKNTVIIDFETRLEDSTTYTFNFRDAIQDITEKNPVENLQVAFSTGPYIDSLSIEGTIYDMITGKELKDATVAIHLPNDTFNILEHPSSYFTKTDDKGTFKIDHLKPNTYYLYAIADKNRNLIADSRTESYGFLSEPIQLSEDTSNIPVSLVKLDTRPLKITSARPYNTYFNIKTTKNLKTFDVSATDSSTLYYAFGEDQANIRIYNSLDSLEEADSLQIRLTALDSIENKIDTTLYIKFLDREVIPDKFDAGLKSSSIIADKGLLSATLTFTKPVRTINFDSIFFDVDSTTRINFSQEDLQWEKLYNRLLLKKTLDKKLFEPEPEEAISPQGKMPIPKGDSLNNKPPAEQISNQLYIGNAAFISIDNDSSKRITQTIKPLKTEDLSKVIYSITTTHENIIIQLVDKNLNVVQEIINKAEGEFTDLTPGGYLMRVIIDRNNNKKWDPGNYLIREEPEQIIYYKNEEGEDVINLKANWDFELSPMLITY